MRIFLAALLLAAVGASFALQAAEKQKLDQRAPQQAASAANQNPQPLAPVVVNITGNTQTVDGHSTAKEHEHEEGNWWKSLWTDPIATFTGALFLATAALIAVGFVQWRETKKSAERQLRAYINVRRAYATWHDDETDLLRPITIIVDFQNTGQTPAHGVTAWIRSHSSATENFDFNSSDDPPDSVGVDGPGQKSHLAIKRDLVLDAESEIKVWERGDKSLYVWGRIDYFDAFEQKRWTKFRFVMPKEGVHARGGRFRPCRGGNEAT